MITAAQIAEKASRILGQTISPRMVREIDNARKQLRAQQRQQIEKGVYIRCVCGCGKTWLRRHFREKIHPDCRQRVYRDHGLLALCKGRVPEVVR